MPGDQRLVEQGPLELRAPPAHRGDHRGPVQVRVEQVARDVGRRGRQRGALGPEPAGAAVRCRYQLGEREVAEGALVDEVEHPLRLACPLRGSQHQPDPQVAVVGRLRRVAHEELPAHPEVRDERLVVVQQEPQELAPPYRGPEPAAGEPAARSAGPPSWRRTLEGRSTSTEWTVQPVTCRASPSRTVSTSGSSGTQPPVLVVASCSARSCSARYW